MPRRSARVLLVLALLPVAALGARKIADFDVVCPLFGHQFTAQSLVRDDPFSAFDSDFCKRSRGESPYVLAVWTCPYCFFSAYQADFRGSLEPRFREMKLRSYPIQAEKVEQVDIFVGTKYLNAETYYREAGRGARFLADLTLRGAWACRVFTVPEPPELQSLRQGLVDAVLAGQQMRSVEEVSLKLQARIAAQLESGEVPEGQVRVYRYLRAGALRQAGEHLQARTIFEELVEEGRLPDRYLRNAGQKSFLCSKEAEFQEKALAYLTAAVEEGLVPEEDRQRTTYLRAELSRRLGRYEEAGRLYRAASAVEGGESWLLTMIRKQERRLPSAEPEDSPVEGP